MPGSYAARRPQPRPTGRADTKGSGAVSGQTPQPLAAATAAAVNAAAAPSADAVAAASQVLVASPTYVRAVKQRLPPATQLSRTEQDRYAAFLGPTAPTSAPATLSVGDTTVGFRGASPTAATRRPAWTSQSAGGHSGSVHARAALAGAAAAVAGQHRYTSDEVAAVHRHLAHTQQLQLRDHATVAAPPPGVSSHEQSLRQLTHDLLGDLQAFRRDGSAAVESAPLSAASVGSLPVGSKSRGPVFAASPLVAALLVPAAESKAVVVRSTLSAVAPANAPVPVCGVAPASRAVSVDAAVVSSQYRVVCAQLKRAQRDNAQLTARLQALSESHHHLQLHKVYGAAQQSADRTRTRQQLDQALGRIAQLSARVELQERQRLEREQYVARLEKWIVDHHHTRRRHNNAVAVAPPSRAAVAPAATALGSPSAAMGFLPVGDDDEKQLEAELASLSLAAPHATRSASDAPAVASPSAHSTSDAVAAHLRGAADVTADGDGDDDLHRPLTLSPVSVDDS